MKAKIFKQILFKLKNLITLIPIYLQCLPAKIHEIKIAIILKHHNGNITPEYILKLLLK